MNVAVRMRKTKEVNGWKQSAVPGSMTSLQDFSYFEQSTGSPRMETLTRFCNVMNVELLSLLAEDILISEGKAIEYGN